MLINVCNQLLMLQYEKETGGEWGNKKIPIDLSASFFYLNK